MRYNLFKTVLLGTVFLILPIMPINRIFGEEINFDVLNAVNWAGGELSSRISFNLPNAGIKLPAGRYLAEETLNQAYPEFLKPLLLSIRVDSNSTVMDLTGRRELSLEELNYFCLAADKVAPNLSSDLTRISCKYTVSMDKLSALLIRHQQASNPERPLIPVPSADYTGIIIIADNELPIHGRRETALLTPCLFPKIWDTGMNLIYERNMFQPQGQTGSLMVRYSPREDIFRSTSSGLEGDLSALLGPNPLRILAREVFGVNPTDPVIDRDDALKILSTENNRRLLQEGRVLFVLNNSKI